MKGKISPRLRQLLDEERMPRTLDGLRARHAAPFTPDTPNVDQVLLATTASAVRQLQAEMETLRQEVARWQRRVTDLEARESL